MKTATTSVATSTGHSAIRKSTVEELLAAPQTSEWLRVSLRLTLQCDPLEAALDAQELAQALTSIAARVLNDAIRERERG